MHKRMIGQIDLVRRAEGRRGECLLGTGSCLPILCNNGHPSPTFPSPPKKRPRVFESLYLDLSAAGFFVFPLIR